jgi:tetratricopeptide (TPR) repeat protein
MSMEEPRTREEQEAFVRDALTRSETCRKRKEYKEGIALLVEALKYGIDKAMVYYRLGNIYIDGGDLARAEYAYKRALDVDPHHVNAMHNLAIVYKRQRKVSQFVKTYKKSQRMEIRYPRNANLNRQQKSHLRRFGFRLILLFVGGVVAVSVVLYLLLH